LVLDIDSDALVSFICNIKERLYVLRLAAANPLDQEHTALVRAVLW